MLGSEKQGQKELVQAASPPRWLQEQDQERSLSFLTCEMGMTVPTAQGWVVMN